jgi:hypothetical protein
MTKQGRLKAMLRRNFNYDIRFSEWRQQRENYIATLAPMRNAIDRRKKHHVRRWEMVRARINITGHFNHRPNPPSASAILPEVDFQAPYIDIDVVALEQILQGRRDITTSERNPLDLPGQVEFARQPVLQFRKLFKIDAQYFPSDAQTPGAFPLDRRFFSCRITTDGISASVHCARGFYIKSCQAGRASGRGKWNGVGALQRANKTASKMSDARNLLKRIKTPLGELTQGPVPSGRSTKTATTSFRYRARSITLAQNCTPIKSIELDGRPPLSGSFMRTFHDTKQ